jgi:hypothetical protein
MICGRAILLADCRARWGQQKDPVVQIPAPCQQEFGDSFWRQAAILDLSRHLMDKAPCRICGGFHFWACFPIRITLCCEFDYFPASIKILKKDG